MAKTKTSQALTVPQGYPEHFIDVAKAPARAEQFIDPKTHALKDDAAIVPIGDRLLVRKIPKNESTYGGLVLPDVGKSEAGYGVVVAAGQGRYNIAGQLIPLRVSAGAVICFGKFAGTNVQVLGFGNLDGDCCLLREEEVFYAVMSRADAAKIAADANPPITAMAAPISEPISEK